MRAPQATTLSKREVRRRDSDISAAAADALLNAEAVLLYNAQMQVGHDAMAPPLT